MRVHQAKEKSNYQIADPLPPGLTDEHGRQLVGERRQGRITAEGADDGTSVALNYDDAELFLETLVGPDWRTTPQVFQTFDDNRDRRRKQAEVARLNGKRSHTDPYAKIHSGVWEKCGDSLA